jgi:hypothetical protein
MNVHTTIEELPFLCNGEMNTPITIEEEKTSCVLYYHNIWDLHAAFNLRYVYDCITKLCRQQAEVKQNYENEHVHSTGQAKPDTENIRGLNLAVVKLITIQVTKLPL